MGNFATLSEPADLAHDAVHPVTGTTLVATELGRQRNGRWLFRNLNFSLQAGELLLVRGSNGCGKTTLLRILAGLSRPDAGSLAWQGPSSSLSYLGHQDGVQAGLTVKQNLDFFHGLAGLSRSNCPHSLLEKIGLAGRDRQPAGQLSAGQRRRLALSRLLINNARFWVLDEPLTALDADAQKLLAGLLARHLETGGMAAVSIHGDIPLPAAGIQRLTLGVGETGNVLCRA